MIAADPTDVKRVFIALGPDRVEEGFYTYADGTVTMVYANGEPVLMDEDEPVTAPAAPDLADAIARVLTKRIRKWALGDSVPGFGKGASIGGYDRGTSDGFGRALTYPTESVT